MTWTGDYRAPFGGEDRTFRLPLGARREIEEKCDAGLYHIFRRLTARAEKMIVGEQEIVVTPYTGIDGGFRTDDYREPIRLGLIGGGMAANEAQKLTERYSDQRPVMESIPLAAMILREALFGPEGIELGKEAGATTASGSPEESSTSPTSTEPAP